MICQLCLAAEASCRVTKRLPSGGFVESHYCLACCASNLHNSPVDPNGFPRVRFTLKRIMILVALFAISNGLVVWFVRSGPVSKVKTPEQLGQWTLTALLMVNFCIGLVVAYVFLTTWLRKVTWYKRTGGVITMPKRIPPSNAISSSQNLVSLSLLVAVTSNFLTQLLTPIFLPIQRLNLFVFIACAALVLSSFVIIAWRTPATRNLVNLFRQEWKCASGPERALKIVAFSWAIAINMLSMSNLIPRRFFWSINVWFILPVLLLVVLACRVLYIVGEALSTRRQ